MQNLPKLELLTRSVRSTICPICEQRPPGSEALLPDVPRSCQPSCTIFLNLPKLVRIAKDEDHDRTAPFEHAIRETICSHCHATPTAGDFCAEGLARTCPLTRHGPDIIETLARVLDLHSRAAG